MHSCMHSCMHTHALRNQCTPMVPVRMPSARDCAPASLHRRVLAAARTCCLGSCPSGPAAMPGSTMGALYHQAASACQQPFASSCSAERCAGKAPDSMCAATRCSDKAPVHTCRVSCTRPRCAARGPLRRRRVHDQQANPVDVERRCTHACAATLRLACPPLFKRACGQRMSHAPRHLHALADIYCCICLEHASPQQPQHMQYADAQAMAHLTRSSPSCAMRA